VAQSDISHVVPIVQNLESLVEPFTMDEIEGIVKHLKPNKHLDLMALMEF
jgi:hypothetical protein